MRLRERRGLFEYRSWIANTEGIVTQRRLRRKSVSAHDSGYFDVKRNMLQRTFHTRKPLQVTLCERQMSGGIVVIT